MVMGIKVGLRCSLINEGKTLIRIVKLYIGMENWPVQQVMSIILKEPNTFINGFFPDIDDWINSAILIQKGSVPLYCYNN